MNFIILRLISVTFKSLEVNIFLIPKWQLRFMLTYYFNMNCCIDYFLVPDLQPDINMEMAIVNITQAAA